MMDARRTGRTTRMLLDALAAARAGRTVIVVAHNSQGCNNLRAQLATIMSMRDVSGPDGNRPIDRILITTPASSNLDWRRMSLASRDSLEGLVLVDHSTIMHQWGTLLEMYHRYDEDNYPQSRPAKEEPEPALPPVGERRMKLGRKT